MSLQDISDKINVKVLSLNEVDAQITQKTQAIAEEEGEQVSTLEKAHYLPPLLSLSSCANE
jgi:hypothetical protein